MSKDLSCGTPQCVENVHVSIQHNLSHVFEAPIIELYLEASYALFQEKVKSS